VVAVSLDFYDGFELVNGRRLGFVVADVCDKGVGAALFMALIRTLLRHTAEHTGGWSPIEDAAAVGATAPPVAGGPPASMLSVGASPLMHAVTGTNHYLVRNHGQQAYFTTLFFGVLDPASGVLLYVNGGHNPPLLRRGPDGEQILLPPTGPAVGLREDSRYMLGSTRLDPGDVVFVYTDGVVDARNLDGQRYTMDRLRKVIDQPVESAGELLDNVDASLREHVQAAHQFDDITMVAVRRADL
jgi:serine phosphatase RsbU (regulator of sigma subunit)